MCGGGCAMFSTSNGGLAIVESMGTGDDLDGVIEAYEERAAAETGKQMKEQDK